jgi:ABC-type glutathione transport system ATPase component
MIVDIKNEIGQRRLEHTVAGLGIIETGLPNSSRISKRPGVTSGKSCRSIDSKSLGTDGTGKVGRVILKKCEAKQFRLTNRIKQISNCPSNVAATSGNESNAKRTLLHPMKVDIPAGSITAIVGTSESGKSTLLKFMAGCADSNLDCDGVGESPLMLFSMKWPLTSFKLTV